MSIGVILVALFFVIMVLVISSSFVIFHNQKKKQTNFCSGHTREICVKHLPYPSTLTNGSSVLSGHHPPIHAQVNTAEMPTIIVSSERKNTDKVVSQNLNNINHYETLNNGRRRNTHS